MDSRLRSCLNQINVDRIPDGDIEIKEFDVSGQRVLVFTCPDCACKKPHHLDIYDDVTLRHDASPRDLRRWLEAWLHSQQKFRRKQLPYRRARSVQRTTLRTLACVVGPLTFTLGGGRYLDEIGEIANFRDPILILASTAMIVGGLALTVWGLARWTGKHDDRD